MPPSRFGASKFRNATPVIPSRDEWYRTHLPQASSSTTSSSTSTFSSEVKSSRRWIVTVTPSGEISWRGYESTSAASDEEKAGVGSMKVGNAGDWDLSRLEDETLVTGGTDGTVTVYRLPSTESDQPTVLHTFSAGSAITTLALHPTTPAVLLVATSHAPLAIYDISSEPTRATITLNLEEPKGLWSCGWSPDGKRLAVIGKSGKCYIFDSRLSPDPTTTKLLSSIQPLRPARVSWVGDQVFITGTDRSRNRLYMLCSSTDLSTMFTQNVDTNLSPLITTIDQERSIIYLSGRGDMSVRQVELGGVTGFQETIHPLPFPMASTSLAAVHPTSLDVMSAEIGRLLVLVVDKDGDAILPLGIKVPRRQLIDYHEDLYPEIAGTIPEQDAKQWLEGGDAKPLVFSLDPSRRQTWGAKLSKTASANSAQPPQKKAVEAEDRHDAHSTRSEIPAPNAVSVPGPTEDSASKAKAAISSPQLDPKGPVETPATNVDNAAKANDQTPVGSSVEPAAEPTSASKSGTETTVEKGEAAASGSNTTPVATTSSPAPTSASDPKSSGDRYNPGWSRKFLAGKSPLNPTYDSLPPLSSLHQDSLIFKISPHVAFFPVQGPGGRLGVHPLKKKGRMINGGEGYLSAGVEIADFDIEPFLSSDGSVRVAIGGEDGMIRIWTVGEDGIRGVGPEAEQVLKGDGVDKIATVAFHPTAKDLLTVLTNDQGSCTVRLFDLASGDEIRKIPLDLDGAFNMIWSPFGDRLAFSTKDSRIVILDPRRPETMVSGPAHDSPRSSQITWIDETHLISIGFSKGSQRRINLYSISSDNTKIETINSALIDVSPSVLFPVYDPDTSILYVWGKGERQIQAFEIRPSTQQEPVSKLPSFTSGSGSPQLGVAWFPKRMVDVKKVEVGRALRLTTKSMEEVSFSIPRNKPDYFQDDIYLDTLDIETPSTSAKEWVEADGKSQGRYITLRPEGMTPLSQAPKTNTEAKKKFVPAANVMSEQEKKQQEMDNLFRKAKMDESSDEDDEPKRSGLDPPDDDW